MIKDVWICIGIIILALVVRGSFLEYVPQVIFDEVHFGKFISSYCCSHERFFDIHPPVGKLIIASVARSSGFQGNFPFEHIGQPFNGVSVLALRFVPALFGSVLAGIVYILLRQLGTSRILASIGGLAIAFDNALILESRLILTDSILLTTSFGALATGIASVQTKSARASWVFVILAGLLAGASVGTKFTGAIAEGLVVVLFLATGLGKKSGTALSWLLKIVLFLLVALGVYLSAWWIHFALLTQPGSGDVWGVPTGHFFADFISLHQQMISANVHLTASHPYGSKWWTWPIMLRSVFYWQGDGTKFIYLLGNPIVWWGAFICFCMAIVNIVRSSSRGSSAKLGMIWLMVIGYFASYVPLMRVPRVLFLYHYLTPLLFSVIISVWFLDQLSIITTKMRAIILIGIIILAFICISPLTYGYSISAYWQSILFAISSWR